ncbi:MAG: S26 family signal peptidase [Planctomycetota bacterium]
MSTSKTQRSATKARPEPKPAAESLARFSINYAREFVETVVFVFVLVSLLRMFGCEAFVIPTGSMATTLMGAHKSATCPECGYVSEINASDEVENGVHVYEGYCQNCQRKLDVAKTRPSGGDRVLVSKFLYEGFGEPQRWDVVVFKCPDTLKTQINFIKRLIGRPGDTVGIRNGDIFIRRGNAQADSPSSPTIARKPPQVMLAVRRLVHDADLQARDLRAAGFSPRWKPREASAWKVSGDGTSFTSEKNELAWVGYNPTLRRSFEERWGIESGPQLVTDFEAYNSGPPSPQRDLNWVGDLMLECDVTPANGDGKSMLELREGGRKYRLILDHGKGTVSLEQNDVELAKMAWSLSSSRHRVRFANFDDRLTVWIDEKLVFGDGVEVTALGNDEIGPTVNDLEPAWLGSTASGTTFSGVRLFRDLYYTQTARQGDAPLRRWTNITAEELLDQWRETLSKLPLEEFEVPEDSYFMLGDNSPKSSDSREWTRTHFVPRHLLLGRALILYWPVWNWKFVR